jgi:thymidylate synthase ThyX
MKSQYKRLFILVEIHEGNSIEEFNNWLMNKKVSEQIAVYRNARMSTRYPLNLAGLVQLYTEKHPSLRFLFSFSQTDTAAYFKYLKKQAKELSIEKLGEYSRKMENQAKKLEDYFREGAPKGSSNPPEDAKVEMPAKVKESGEEKELVIE